MLVTAPIKQDGVLDLVVGVNHHLYDPQQHQLVTAASCTTNCLAPVVKVLHEALGIRHGCITTIHDVTNTQTILDAHHKDLRRSRACGMSLIPTTTGSATAITHIFPDLKGKLNGNMPPGHFKNLWETLLAGREWHGEFHNKKKNGDLFWEYARISPIRNNEEQITHFVAVKENITERKRLQTELMQAKQAAEDELKMMGRDALLEQAAETAEAIANHARSAQTSDDQIFFNTAQRRLEMGEETRGVDLGANARGAVPDDGDSAAPSDLAPLRARDLQDLPPTPPGHPLT